MEDNVLQGLKIDHIGVAVKSIVEATKVYEMLGYTDIRGKDYVDELQGVHARFLDKDGVSLELLEPLYPDKPSPLDAYLKGSLHTMYHICYKTADLEETAEALRKNRFRMIVGPIPGVAFGESGRICFMFNRRVGIIELMEEGNEDV